MKVTKKDIIFFQENGYVVIDNVFPVDQIKRFDSVMNVIIQRVVERALQDTNNESLNKINDFINEAIPLLRKIDTRYPTIIQRTLNRTPEFFHLVSNPKIAKAVHQLNQYDADNPLYLLSNCLIFSDPCNYKDTAPSNFILDWHNDVFSTIPYNRFTHMWIPLVSDCDEELGTIMLCPKSHKKLVKQQLNIDVPYNHRFTVPPEDLAPFDPISVDVKLGQGLFFDGNMIHRSGQNATDRMRYTMIGLFHDIYDEHFFPVATAYRYMQHTPYQHFYELFQDENAKRLIREELEPDSDIRRTSV